MRLIDADALKKKFPKNDMCDYEEFCEFIDNAPTVTNVEVEKEFPHFFRRPHGEWVDTASGYKCSVCGKENDYAYDEYKHKFTDYFCPNCGADMRGKENE